MEGFLSSCSDVVCSETSRESFVGSSVGLPPFNGLSFFFCLSSLVFSRCLLFSSSSGNNGSFCRFGSDLAFLSFENPIEFKIVPTFPVLFFGCSVAGVVMLSDGLLLSW